MQGWANWVVVSFYVLLVQTIACAVKATAIIQLSIFKIVIDVLSILINVKWIFSLPHKTQPLEVKSSRSKSKLKSKNFLPLKV